MASDHNEEGRSGAGAGPYPVAEAARLLGITESAVRKRVDRGDLVGELADGGRLRVSRDSVDGERSRLLARLDPDGQAELGSLRNQIDQLSDDLATERSERQRLKAAFESLRVANAALQDTILQLTSEQRVSN